MSRDNNEYANISTNSAVLAQDIQTDQYRTLFEMLPQAALYYGTNAHILVANLAAQSVFGLTFNQLHEYNSSVLFCDEDGHPLREEEWPVHRVLAGKTLKGATTIDIIIRGPEEQERLMNVNGSPIYDANRQIRGALITFQDITFQHTTEHQTQRSLDAILAMAEAMILQGEEDPEATISLEDELEVSGSPVEGELPSPDLFGRHLLELPCRLLGCQRVAIVLLDPQTEILTPVASIGISPEYEQHWRNSLYGARLHSLIGSQDLVERLRAGEMLSLDPSHQPFRDLPSHKLIAPILKNGQLLGILLLAYGSVRPSHTAQELAIIHAVSNLACLLIEREKALQDRNNALQTLQIASGELERTSKVKGDFLGIISHEFRTALTGIQGFSEIMRDKDLSIAEMKEFAIDIHTDARRLVRMITGMLDLDHKEASHLQLNPSWLDLNAIIIDAVVRIRQMDSNYVIRLQLANALPILRGDFDKLTLVVTDLLQNAILHSPPGGEIAVSSQIEGNVVHVCIRDYGAGLTSTELERIFERPTHANTNPLFHIEHSRPELFIVREIVQMHGGQVWAESVSGKGSIFHFTVRFTSPG